MTKEQRRKQLAEKLRRKLKSIEPLLSDAKMTGLRVTCVIDSDVEGKDRVGILITRIKEF